MQLLPNNYTFTFKADPSCVGVTQREFDLPLALEGGKGYTVVSTVIRGSLVAKEVSMILNLKFLVVTKFQGSTMLQRKYIVNLI